MTEIEIGRAKRGRQAYAFDDIAIVPSRRTRDPEEVSVAWQIDAYRFDIPFVTQPTDAVVSPAVAAAVSGIVVKAFQAVAGVVPPTAPSAPHTMRSSPS